VELLFIQASKIPLQVGELLTETGGNAFRNIYEALNLTKWALIDPDPHIKRICGYRRTTSTSRGSAAEIRVGPQMCEIDLKPDTVRKWSDLSRSLMGEHGFAKKPTLIGLSRGGL